MLRSHVGAALTASIVRRTFHEPLTTNLSLWPTFAAQKLHPSQVEKKILLLNLYWLHIYLTIYIDFLFAEQFTLTSYLFNNLYWLPICLTLYISFLFVNNLYIDFLFVNNL